MLLHRDVLRRIKTKTDGQLVRQYNFSQQPGKVAGGTILKSMSQTAYADNPDNDVHLPGSLYFYKESKVTADSIPTGYPYGHFEDVEAQAYSTFEMKRASGDITNLEAGLRDHPIEGHYGLMDMNLDNIPDYVDAGVNPPVIHFGHGQPVGDGQKAICGAKQGFCSGH